MSIKVLFHSVGRTLVCEVNHLDTNRKLSLTRGQQSL